MRTCFQRDDVSLRRCLATLLVLLVGVAPRWGCGAKGPPLAPLVVVPVPVTELAVRRLGDEVYVGFTLPTRNRDAPAWRR